MRLFQKLCFVFSDEFILNSKQSFSCNPVPKLELGNEVNANPLKGVVKKLQKNALPRQGQHNRSPLRKRWTTVVVPLRGIFQDASYWRFSFDSYSMYCISSFTRISINRSKLMS